MKNRNENSKNGRRVKVPFRTALMSALSVAFVLSIIFAYFAMLFFQTRQSIIKNGQLNAMNSSSRIDKYLSSGVDTMKLISYTLDNMIRTGKSQEEFRQFLINQTEAISNIENIHSTGFYAYINGEYLDGIDWKPTYSYDPTTRPWFIAAQANGGKVAVVDPYLDAQLNEMTITFSKTLCDVKSVAAIDYSISSIQEIVEQTAASGDSKFELLLNRSYQVIAHSAKSEVGNDYLSESDTFGSELVKKLRSANKDFFSFRYRGTEYIVYSVKISNDWICLSVSDASRAYAPLILTLVFTVIAVLLVLTILLTIIIRFNRRQAQFTALSMHVVEALAAAIDAKDPYTNGHSGRVAAYSREIGKRFGYSQKKQEEIYMMGLLHDVGKIGIPDAVINKPGKLTDEEFEIIKTHPATGAYILSKTSELPRMAVGAHWHHERYDGKGYPDGLSGTDIEEEARIIAVADAYDAMSSCRSYRDMLPQDVVRSEIEKGRSTQFDPAFAEIMLGIIDEDKDYKLHG
ncbi:MAG: HD domain-containing protein [Clostridia bacterium]|nr:HD domain-containing protein [Clostridia bacterium]